MANSVLQPLLTKLCNVANPTAITRQITRPPPYLIRYHETFCGCAVEYLPDLRHFDHECGAVSKDVIIRADTVKIRSTRPKRELGEAGMNEPDWAKMVRRAMERRKVDLPPMLGPVITCTAEEGGEEDRESELGVKRRPRSRRPSFDAEMAGGMDFHIRSFRQ